MIDLNSLNPPQKEAVLHTEGPLLVLAGAASDSLRTHATQNQLRLIDYLAREELAIRNAVPVALAV